MLLFYISPMITSEETVLILPLTIYHSLAVPEFPTSSPNLIPTYPYTAPMSPMLLPPSPGAELVSVYTSSEMQECDPAWMSPSALLASNYLPNPHVGRETHNWQDNTCSSPSPVPRSVSTGPRWAPYYTPGLSTSYTPSPRLLPPPPPTSVPYAGYNYPGAPTETVNGHINPDQIGSLVASPTSQNIHLAAPHRSVSPGPHHYTSSQPRAQDQSPTLNHTRPPPIQIPSLPNPHDSQGVLHSPRPVPSPKHSFYGSIPKSGSVSELERMVDEVGKQSDDLSSHLPKSDAGVDGRGPHSHKAGQQLDLSVDKTLPAPPVPSSKERQLPVQRPHVDTLFTTEELMPGNCTFPSSTNQIAHAPPTPPIAAITPIKFPKAPTELSGLGANWGKDVPPGSGLDALERRLLAEVGTRRFDKDERPHVRSVVQPITIPPSGPPPDTANDSAISSLTLADRDGLLKAPLEREQEQDRDSDERTQHNGRGGHSPSEDDRDARTQKGKSSRKLGKSKHSEEDLEKAGRRRERKRVKNGEGRRLRKEAKGRVAAWLGEIDISVPPAMDDPTSFISLTASHFVPITESASFDPTLAEMTGNKVEGHRRGDISTDKDVSASPNPRSSGFVTISTLNAVATTDTSGGEASSLKPSPRRSSLNDFRQTPSSSPHRVLLSRSPSAEVKPSEPSDAPVQTQHSQSRSQPPRPQPNRISPGRLPHFPAKPADPEVKYDIRSARGGRGGKVTHVASLWAAKANANANANAKTGDTTPMPAPAPKKPKLPASQPAVRKPVLNVLKRSPISARSSPAGPGGGTTLIGPNRIGETRTAVGVGTGLGTREVSKPTKATTVPAVLSSSHAVPMLSSTASLARVKPYGPGLGLGQGRTLPPMISETISDLRSVSKSSGGVRTGAGAGAAGGGGAQARPLGDLAFGQARLRDLIKKYQG